MTITTLESNTVAVPPSTPPKTIQDLVTQIDASGVFTSGPSSFAKNNVNYAVSKKVPFKTAHFEPTVLKKKIRLGLDTQIADPKQADQWRTSWCQMVETLGALTGAVPELKFHSSKKRGTTIRWEFPYKDDKTFDTAAQQCISYIMLTKGVIETHVEANYGTQA